MFSICVDPETNLVMKVLKTKDDPRHFSEKLMFLINRGGKLHEAPSIQNTVSYTAPSLSPSPLPLPLPLPLPPSLPPSLPLPPTPPDDPVALQKPLCPDSLTKFALDVFSSGETATMFYTTDLMVLIDIVLRQISDLCPGDEVGRA